MWSLDPTTRTLLWLKRHIYLGNQLPQVPTHPPLVLFSPYQFSNIPLSCPQTLAFLEDTHPPCTHILFLPKILSSSNYWFFIWWQKQIPKLKTKQTLPIYHSISLVPKLLNFLQWKNGKSPKPPHPPIPKTKHAHAHHHIPPQILYLFFFCNGSLFICPVWEQWFGAFIVPWDFVCKPPVSPSLRGSYSSHHKDPLMILLPLSFCNLNLFNSHIINI